MLNVGFTDKNSLPFSGWSMAATAAPNPEPITITSKLSAMIPLKFLFSTLASNERNDASQDINERADRFED